MCIFLLSSLYFTNNYLESAKEIISTERIPLTSSEALNYINPLYDKESKISAGKFLATHYPQDINKDSKIPYTVYINVLDKLTQKRLQPLASILKIELILSFIGSIY